jgi:phospholipid/cholesterol/gamma-HCH transport system substrate-binding protein
MARRLSWSDVRGGLFATCAILIAAFATLKFSRVGALHGDTFHLYALVGEARGVLVGSEVWLSGQKIGKIVDIQFRPPMVGDTSSRIEIDMQVLERYRSAMHRDALAQIRSGGTIIGAPVVYITPGTIAAPPMRDGDTVNTKSQADFEGSAGKFGQATLEFPVIMSNVDTLLGFLKTTQGTAGAMLNAPGGLQGGELGRMRQQASQLSARLQGDGRLGGMMNGVLSARAAAAMSRVDSVRALLASPNTSYGRFRRDSTLLADVSDIRNQLTIVRSLVDEPRGTAGRVLRDSAITRGLADAEHQMTLLMADLKKHPFRYISF